MASDVAERPSVALDSLPWEMLNEISDYLDRKEILALSFVCKNLGALAERALYTVVKVWDKVDITSHTRIFASKPYLLKIVRKYRVGWHAPWWSLDLLDSFCFLREFVFRPGDLAQGDAMRMVRTLSAGAWIQHSLRRCS